MTRRVELRGRKQTPSDDQAHAPATVAGDLHALTAEILERILARERQHRPQAGGEA